jgi:hypothetical protein
VALHSEQSDCGGRGERCIGVIVESQGRAPDVNRVIDADMSWSLWSSIADKELHTPRLCLPGRSSDGRGFRRGPRL